MGGAPSKLRIGQIEVVRSPRSGRGVGLGTPIRSLSAGWDVRYRPIRARISIDPRAAAGRLAGVFAMTATREPREVLRPTPITVRPFAHEAIRGTRLSLLLRTTDHKVIGQMYLVASFGFFVLGGAMAMLMR